jgi:hypothetical protein
VAIISAISAIIRVSVSAPCLGVLFWDSREVVAIVSNPWILYSRDLLNAHVLFWIVGRLSLWCQILGYYTLETFQTSINIFVINCLIFSSSIFRCFVRCSSYERFRCLEPIDIWWSV